MKTWYDYEQYGKMSKKYSVRRPALLSRDTYGHQLEFQLLHFLYSSLLLHLGEHQSVSQVMEEPEEIPGS